MTYHYEIYILEDGEWEPCLKTSHIKKNKRGYEKIGQPRRYRNRDAAVNAALNFLRGVSYMDPIPVDQIWIKRVEE